MLLHFQPHKSRLKGVFRRRALAAALLSGSLLGVGCSRPPQPARPLETMALEHPPNYPDRAQVPDPNCGAPGPEAAAPQWPMFAELEKSGGPLTRGLLSYARAANLRSCFAGSQQAPEFVPGTGVLRLPGGYGRAQDMLHDIHATVLAWQWNERLSRPRSSVTIYGRIMQAASAEAAARAAEFVVARELKTNGDSSLIDVLDRTDPAGWKAFKKNYKASGDVSAASAAAANALLRDPGFIRPVADAAMNTAFTDWSRGQIDDDPARSFTSAEARKLGEVSGGVALAHGVSLPSRSEFLRLLPEFARPLAVLSAFPRDVRRLRMTADKMGGKGNTYSFRQGISRVDSDLTGRFQYPARASNPRVQPYCTQADYRPEQVPSASYALWENLQTLRKGALLGPALVDFSVRADVFHCYFDMSDKNVGEWHDDDGLVRVSNAAGISKDAALTTQAHELLHGIQRTTGVGAFNPAWTIADMQMDIMAYEAASKTVQYLVALELWDKDIQEPWRLLYNSYGVSDAATDAYDKAQRRKLPQAEVLKAAGAAAWTAQFKDSGWADSYNNQILASFIKELAGGRLEKPSSAHYTLETARRTGWVSDQLNFTADIAELPSYEQRFAGNSRMHQAFDYAELSRLRYTQGEWNASYKQELERLKRDGNPYIGVDLTAVDKELQKPGMTATALEVMNCFANLGCPAAAMPTAPPQVSAAAPPVLSTAPPVLSTAPQSKSRLSKILPFWR
jgi:hypothetical protein